MTWQSELAELIMTRAPTGSVQTVGSATRPEQLDGWSDLDLHLHLDADVALAQLVDPGTVWLLTEASSPDDQVLRLVLTDGRRLDLSVRGRGRLVHDQDTTDDDPRMLLVLAVTKLGRGDRLIGDHLLLELAQHCLILLMRLRDRDEGTTRHRTGTARDLAADDVRALLRLPRSVRDLPGLAEAACRVHDRAAAELDPSYRPDWRGLAGVLARGLSPDAPAD